MPGPDEQPTLDTPSPEAPPESTPEPTPEISAAAPAGPAVSGVDGEQTVTQPHAGGRSKAHGSFPPLPPPPPNAPKLDGYHLLEKLGEGGMGVVWKAVQLATRREVALKLLGSAAFGSDHARLRFEREVELAARLEHPFIARVYDSGLTRDLHYYAMELVTGADLETHVRGNTLRPRDVLRLVRDVCLGVQHAHQRGVIHRDLKPSNILVSGINHEDTKGTKDQPENPEERSRTTPTLSGTTSREASGHHRPSPKIVDFGLAKTLLAEDGQVTLSQTGQVAGTPAYMSPEQASGQTDRIDTRTDVYALGVILYRLLTGKFPHDTTVPFATLLRHISEDPVIPPRRATDDASKIIDKELETLLLKALDKDPDRRYDNAGALAADLENYLEGKPLLAKSPTTGYVLKKQIMRHRKAVIAASVCGLFMLGGLGAGTAWLHQRPVKIPVDSEPPGGHLRINGELKLGCGVTPCYATLGPGDHTIEVVLPGHYQPEMRQVSVNWGQASSKAWEPVAMKPDFRTVLITTDPELAHVQVRREDNGEVVETSRTPAMVVLPGGRYTLHFSPDGEAFPESGKTLAVVGDAKPLRVVEKIGP